MSNKEPNLFIIGAPKTGTTSLAEHLSGHPDVFFSRVKEPHYFSTDFTNYGFKGRYEEYLEEFFRECPEEAKVVAEGSTWYYYSDHAVKNILKVNAKAKFIFMVRNPVEMLNSLYLHKRRLSFEDQLTFRAAWEMEACRRNGADLPVHCREPRRAILYSEVASFGAHLQKLQAQIPAQQLKVILFDDLVSEARNVYLDVLAFLGLDDDGCDCSSIANPYSSWRSQSLGRHLFRQFERVNSQLDGTQPCSSKMKYKTVKFALRVLRRLNRKRSGKPDLDKAMKKEILCKLSKDIDLLSSLLGKDLSAWRNF